MVEEIMYVDVPTWWIVVSAILLVIGVVCIAGAFSDGPGFLIVIGMLAIVSALFLGGASIGNTMDIKSCKILKASTGYDTKYPSLIQGCYVYVNNRWIPVENWRGEDY
jgi:drug/metabolite transporter (DMT)-like permease